MSPESEIMRIPASSPRRSSSSLEAKSPLGRRASGPWTGPFDTHNVSAGCESPKCVFVDAGGLCFGDLDGRSASLELPAEEAVNASEPLLDCWQPPPEEAEGGSGSTRALALLLGLPGHAKGASLPAKEKPLRTVAPAGPKCSNKLLRKRSALQQPRRQN